MPMISTSLVDLQHPALDPAVTTVPRR